jgi:hypothetical protein
MLTSTQAMPITNFRRNGKTPVKPYQNASNLQLLERTIEFLIPGRSSWLDRVVALGILSMLMDGTIVEQQSVIWEFRRGEHVRQLIRYWHDANNMDQDELWCLAWVSFDAASAVAPPRNKEAGDDASWSALLSSDPRFELGRKVFEWFGPSGAGWSFERMEAMMMRFFWADSCRASWKYMWDHHENSGS